MGIALALADVTAAFRGVSVSVNGAELYKLRAVNDPADIQTPTVWIPVPEVEFQYMKRRLLVTWVAYLIGPNSPKQRTTTDHLSAMVDAVTGLFPYTTGGVYQLTLPGGVTAQSYRLEWNASIAIGD